MSLRPCCSALVDRYRALMGDDPRDGAALYCPACQTRVRIEVARIDGMLFVSARTEDATQ